MIISSELTGETYKTVEDCLAAEKRYREKLREKQRAEKAHREELDKAYKEAMEACGKYFELAGVDFKVTDDGSIEVYHNKFDDGFLNELAEAFFGL